MITGTDALGVYIQIAAYIVPLIAGSLLWLLFRHFDLKERVRDLEKDMESNVKSDVETKANYEKLWEAVQGISKTLSALEVEVRIVAEKLKTP